MSRPHFSSFSPHRKRIEGTKLWQIETLRAMKKEGGCTLYLVEWKITGGVAYPASWEPKEHITDGAIAEFEKASLDVVAVECFQPLDPVHDAVIKKLLNQCARLLNSNARPGEMLIEVPELGFTATAIAYLRKVLQPRLLSVSGRHELKILGPEVVREWTCFGVKPLYELGVGGRRKEIGMEVIIDTMRGVFDFCAFHRFHPKEEALGCYR